MSMNRLEIRNAVYQNLGWKGERETDFNNWINWGLNRIADSADFLCTRNVATGSFTVATLGTLSTHTYTLPSRFKSLYNLRLLTDSGYDVTEVDPDEFDSYYPYAENDALTRPKWFIRRSPTTFQVYPGPETTYNYSMRYSEYPLALTSDTSSQPYPTQYDRLVVIAATVEASIGLDELESLQKWEGKYNQAVAELLSSDRRKPKRTRLLGRMGSTSQALGPLYWANPDVGRR